MASARLGPQCVLLSAVREAIQSRRRGRDLRYANATLFEYSFDHLVQVCNILKRVRLSANLKATGLRRDLIVDYNLGFLWLIQPSLQRRNVHGAGRRSWVGSSASLSFCWWLLISSAPARLSLRVSFFPA